MAKTLKAGDHVSWNTPGGGTKGEVVRKATGTTQIKGHKAVASKTDPQYVVRSDKSGKEAAHKASALRKAG